MISKKGQHENAHDADDGKSKGNSRDEEGRKPNRRDSSGCRKGVPNLDGRKGSLSLERGLQEEG